MDPLIGSGKITTTPIVSDDGTSVNGCSSRPNSLNVERKRDDKSKELKWKYSLHQIGLDVARTDRALTFYESESNQAKLADVLAVYSWVDSDIDYVQEDVAGGQYLFAIRMLMVLFRREFSFMDSLDLWEFIRYCRRWPTLLKEDRFQLIWGMEYNPNIFSMYKDSREASAAEHDEKLLKQCSKFERKIVKTGQMEEQSALAVFLLASILETKKKSLLTEASAIDDVVEILGGITGKFDARKACKEALKIHKKYLDKQGKSKYMD